MPAAPLPLSAHAITKKFPGVVALREVSFDLRAGEIHALCGENGAGKSTLIKLLSGIHAHGSYDGELRVDGESARFFSIADAERAGLAVIYQELALVEEMSVAENIFLGAEPTRFGLVDWPRIHREARAVLAQFNVAIDPTAPCSRLGVGQKQLVEIVKALRKNSRILILDEPTAALAEHEVQILLDILRDLRQRGISCIYISHKLDEVFALADRITVLRDGASIVTLDTSATTKTEVIRHMVGREIGELFPRRAGLGTTKAQSHEGEELPAAVSVIGDLSPLEPEVGTAEARRHGDEERTGTAHPRPDLHLPSLPAPCLRASVVSILRVENLGVADARTGKLRLDGITFDLAPGEVLGIGGLMGAGRTELLMHLFGAWGMRRGGRVELAGRELPPLRPAEVLRRGLALVSEDRRRYGLILDQNIGFNLSLSSLAQFTRGGLIDARAEGRKNAETAAALRVKAPHLEAVVGKLSGGNQQKVVLGKALMTDPRVILLDEPTRGIDVGAKLEIYEIINQLTDAGRAVVLVSSELPELIGMSDRILILHAGRPAGTFTRAEATPERLLRAAMGT